MVLLQNTQPKITKLKIPKVKQFLTKIWIFVKRQVLVGQEQKFMKNDNSNICKIKFSVT